MAVNLAFAFIHNYTAARSDHNFDDVEGVKLEDYYLKDSVAGKFEDNSEIKFYHLNNSINQIDDGTENVMNFENLANIVAPDLVENINDTNDINGSDTTTNIYKHKGIYISLFHKKSYVTPHYKVFYDLINADFCMSEFPHSRF